MNPLSVITSVLDGGILTKVTGGVMAIVLVGTIAYGAYSKFEVSHLTKNVTTLQAKVTQLQTENGILTSQSSELRQQVQQLAQANYSNFVAAQKLAQEREANVIAVKALAQDQKHSQEAFNSLTAKINAMIKDPHNDGPVAPVLREVIREIEIERSKR